VVDLQPMVGDQYFTAAQRDRLSILMAHGRAARDAKTELSPNEQAELEDLIRAELDAAACRAAALLH